ncbi:MAG: tyrosine-type recombinase/integrase [Thermodesulfobacteriota bacterium]
MGLYRRGKTWWMSFVYKGKSYRRSTETTERKLAQRILDKVKGEIAEGKWFERLAGEDKTFHELMTKYMEEHSKPKKRAWTRDTVSLSHLKPFFGEYKLMEITPSLISNYKSIRRKEGAAPASINRELSLCKHAFNLAYKEWDWVRENPFCKVKMERENNERDRILAYEEEKRLLEVSPPWLKEIITFALNTGCREGEILGLTWQDVDLFKRIVVIHQTKTGHTKTIPLTPTLFELLKIKNKVRHLYHNLVFPSANGTRFTASNLGRSFRSALKKAKIDNLRFHDLRHTFASRLAQSGVDLYLIQKLLGHRDPRMVQRYSHHSVESLRSGIEVLEKIKLENEKNSFTISSQ